MNIFTTQPFVRQAWRWSVLLAGIILVSGARADMPQPGRFLLIFETSAVLKKNLPVVKATLDSLFSSNLQRELQDNDDLAVWTVDQDLHTGTFPLASWSPADAEMYSSRLNDFLGHQKFSKHANLAVIQPLLNRVVKNSEKLTVLIFCAGQSNRLGTPYDSGVNAIIKKATAENQGKPGLFVLVLRSYQGEYLGCSANRPGSLSFPPFPAPPKPEPPPVSKPAPVAPPAVAVIPMPALIIVGTNVGTNVSALAKPAPAPATNAPAASPPAHQPPIVAVPAPTVFNPPPPAKPAPAPAPVIPKVSAPISTPEPITAAPAPVVAINPPMANNAIAVAATTTDTPPDTGFEKLIIISGGLLVAAVGLVIWLATRSRRPVGSLISSSMQDDPRLPPRK